MSHEHRSLLENHFKSAPGSVEFLDQGGRALARYFYDGYAPTPELQKVFEAFKRELVAIYEQLLGTPLEKEIHEDVRRVFDEILNKKRLGSRI